MMLFALLKVFVETLVFLTAPIVFVFVSKERDRMPAGFLQLYEDYNYGINGDPYWVNAALSDHPANDEEARSWKWRVLWCWRNANTLDHQYGLDTRTVVRVEYVGDPKTGNRPGHSGTLGIVAYDRNGGRYECSYVVKQWGSSGRCLRSYTGYKLKDLLDFWIANGGSTDPALMDAQNLRRIAPRVFSWNPLMGYAQ